MQPVLILGGYGNFGGRIASALAKADIPIIIAGRNQKSALAKAELIKNNFPHASINTAIFDIKDNLDLQLKQLRPVLFINAAGPFQRQDYSAVETCIANGVHYIDIADARDFVTGIPALNKYAEQQGVTVISGASTVPGLSSAVLDYYQPQFSQINSIIYGIAPGQKTPRGLATTKSILSYLGKPLASKKTRYGWQDLYRQPYPVLGNRWMGNCDIPDFDLFPQHYGISEMRFSGSVENSFLHLSTWCLSGLIRLGLPLNLEKHAALLLQMSHYFDRWGTADGGMHMIIDGLDENHQKKRIEWFIIVTDGEGPQVPAVPAIILTKKLVSGKFNQIGAMSSMNLITLPEYLEELRDYPATTYENGKIKT